MTFDYQSLTTFFMLIHTLTLTLGPKKSRFPVGLNVLLWLLAYSAAMLPEQFVTLSAGISYVLYLIRLIGMGVLYAWFMVKGSFKNKLALLLVYQVIINCSQGIADTLSLPVPAYFISLFLMGAFCIYFSLHPLKAPDHMPISYWSVIMGMPIVIVVLMQSYVMHFEPIFSAFDTPLPFFLLILIFQLTEYYLSYTTIRAYERFTEAAAMNQQLQLQVEYLNRANGMVEQIRRDKHEMKNVYFYIEMLVNEGNYNELGEFVRKKLHHRSDALEEFHTGNTVIDAVLTQKVSEARSESIHVMTDVILSGKIIMEDSDLCGVLLNVIDNAIDAEKTEETGSRDIQITMKQVKNYLSVRVRNKVSHDILADNPDLKTTKADSGSHGIGLSVIRSIVKKYNGMMDYYMENGYFVMDLMLAVCGE